MFVQGDVAAIRSQVPKTRAALPDSGVGLAMEAGVPPEVCHIIAAHAGEGNLVQRTTEAYVVHHADFMTFLPFKNKG